MINVAVDGPSGAGKSTISRELASRLGFMYIDTGAMYRALAYKALRRGTDIGAEPEKVVQMLENTSLDVVYDGGVQRIVIDGEDVTDCIRTPEVSLGASAIAAIPEVRKWLLELQRELARNNNCLMDGRDIGSFVLPHADVKIFLTASAENRAKRRFDELTAKGAQVNYDEVLRDMITRDKNDASRACSPLKMADDAILVDTSDLNFEQSVEAVKKIIEKEVGAS